MKDSTLRGTPGSLTTLLNFEQRLLATIHYCTGCRRLDPSRLIENYTFMRPRHWPISPSIHYRH